jgi:hypothetical protein
MPLLNYTTAIAPTKTVMEIQSILAKHGASAILTEFDRDGFIVALSFKVQVNGNDIGFKLPTNWKPVHAVLQNDRKVSRSQATPEQALRVAWRITKDWVEAQMAMIDTQMVSIQQVFLPYAVTQTGETVYEAFANNPAYLLSATAGGDNRNGNN